MAQRTASLLPVEIITDEDSMGIQNKLSKAFPLSIISMASACQIDPDSSTSRLSRTVRQRVENNNNGPLDGGIMERILRETVISINLFELTNLEGNPTPAEAGGTEGLFRDWGDLTLREKPNTPSTYRSRNSEEGNRVKTPPTEPASENNSPAGTAGENQPAEPKQRRRSSKAKEGQDAQPEFGPKQVAQEQLRSRIDEIKAEQHEVSQYLEHLAADQGSLERALELMA